MSGKQLWTVAADDSLLFVIVFMLLLGKKPEREPAGFSCSRHLLTHIKIFWISMIDFDKTYAWFYVFFLPSYVLPSAVCWVLYEHFFECYSYLFIFPLLTQSLIQFISIPFSIIEFLRIKSAQDVAMGKLFLCSPHHKGEKTETLNWLIIFRKAEEKEKCQITELRLINLPIKFFRSPFFISLIETNFVLV